MFSPQAIPVPGVAGLRATIVGHLERAELAELDAWRPKQDPKPSRPVAFRRLAKIAMDTEGEAQALTGAGTTPAMHRPALGYGPDASKTICIRKCAAMKCK